MPEIRVQKKESREEVVFASLAAAFLAIQEGDLKEDDLYFSIKLGEWRPLREEAFFKEALFKSAGQTVSPFGPVRKGKRFVNYVIDCWLVGYVIGYLVRTATGNSFALLLPILGLFLYFFILEAATGRTLGKLLTGTVVITEDNRPLGVEAAFLRTLIRFIPLEPLSYLGSSDLGWHDRWTHTVVVDRSRVTSTGR